MIKLTLLFKKLFQLNAIQKFFQLKAVRVALSAFIFFSCIALIWHAYIGVREWKFFNDNYINLRHRFSSNGCEIPAADPFDKTVVPYIKYKKPLKCKIFQPDLTYMDYEGILTINQSAIDEHSLERNLLACYYRTLTRKEGDDDKVIYDPEHRLNNSVKISKNREFVSVRCEYKGVNNYHNHHWYVPEKDLGEKISQDKPQVFILVIESLSRINAIRHLPKTYNYLTKVMKSEVLNGLTKVADNSFVNMVPFLTGRKVYSKIPELPGNEKTGPYDGFPLIWKNFSKAGYVTAFTEDNPEYTVFNYLSKGFMKQPTDYYPRPLWLSMFDSPLLKSSSDFCLGSITSYNILFNWVKEFVIKYSKKLYFLFAFYIAIAHNDFNEAQYLDSDMLELLKNLNEKGYFQNTIVIVMGDHGNRYGEILRTKIGHIEERMPLFSITIPFFLEKQHPHLRSYLKDNSNMLTTWFDIYALLMDIATSTYHTSRATHVWNTRGFSPWRMKVPKNRTCDEAGVPYNYCICLKETEMENDDPSVIEASNELVDHLNTILEDVRPLCVDLSLGAILKAVVLLPMENMARKGGYSLQLRIQVSLKPSNGIVEAILEKSAWSLKFQVVGDVSRLNKYGNQSICIQHKVLRKFCYCKS